MRLVEAGRDSMKKLFVTLVATSALALGACQSKEADKVEDAAEAQADAIDDQADAMPDGPAKEAMEQKADVVEEKGEEKANAMDDNGEIAPSETGVGDTQKK
jgi:Ni/Co efflux regulator RcnB